MSSVRPGVPAHGPAREDDRRAQRADSRSRAEHAQAGRPDVEHVLREDGQQGDGTAEQDGEEVERDGAEQHGRAADQPHAAEHAREVGRRAAGRRRARRGASSIPTRETSESDAATA